MGVKESNFGGLLLQILHPDIASERSRRFSQEFGLNSFQNERARVCLDWDDL
tara:strand:+ start:83 stop:238 length:156 start_codon:yes stop_codon:yes gene_type:complete